MGAPAVGAVRGAAGSGKTQAVVERASRLADEGVAPEDVLAVAAGPDSALELGARLRARLGERAPRAVSWLRLAFGLAGRPRVLSAPERSLLLADLRAAGYPAVQVSAALKAACEAWGRGGQPDPAEGACLRDLLAALDRRGAVLPEALVARALEQTRPCVAHVLVDDADLLPAAAQLLVERVATADVCAAGEPGRGAGGSQAAALVWAPAPGGTDDARSVSELPLPAKRIHAGTFQAVKWADTAEEAAGAAALADHALSEARGEHGRGPVVLVAPNRAWARRARQALEQAGIEACDGGCSQPLMCDPRDPVACAPLRCLALLGLAADRRDVASWRAWCALGNADLACGSWRNLEAYAQAEGLGAVETLMRACEKVRAGEAPFAGAHQLEARVRQALSLIDAHDLPRRGFPLLDALDPSRTEAFRQLFALPGDEVAAMGAQGLFQAAVQAALDPALGVLPCEVRGADAFEGAAEAGRRASVCLPEGLVGVHPRLLVCLGANEGLYGEQALGRLLAVQADALVVSYLQRMPEALARKLGAAFRRTRSEGGEQVALVQPAAALSRLGREAPATMGGQQFCSTVLGLRP